jgi:hypothetical protein
LKIFLSDIKIIRIVCACGGAVEIPTDKLSAMNSPQCPICTKAFIASRSDGKQDPLLTFAKGITGLPQADDRYHVEFISKHEEIIRDER